VNGNIGFATVIITFLDRPSSCLGFNDRNYYLLATGSSGIDIPSLTIKVAVFVLLNYILFRIMILTLYFF